MLLRFESLSLNPFYFRAGLLPAIARRQLHGVDVLIPFISGLDCCGDDARTPILQLCLNPFYFRAGLLRKIAEVIVDSLPS